jgi:predicted transcriptional regulator
MQTIEETADTMFSHRKLNIQGMLMTYREIKNIIDGIRKNSSNNPVSYNFTGQHTDIAFAAVDEQGLNISAINNIKDNNLRSNVIQNFNDAINDGYLKYNSDTGNFTLTDKGNEHINSSAFKEQFEIDQKNAISDNKAHVNLQGNKSDLEIFRYTEQINLKNIKYDNPAQYKNIVSYFRQCEKYGFVKISDDGTVTATEKCKDYLNLSKAKNINVEKVTPDNVTEIARNMAAKQKTEKASREAAKKAAEKATKETAKAGAKTAAKAATGAATGGTSVAAEAIIELSKLGAKALNNATKFNLKQSTH